MVAGVVEMLRQVRISSPVSVRLAGIEPRVDGVAGVARRARASGAGGGCAARRRLRVPRGRRIAGCERRAPPATSTPSRTRTRTDARRSRRARARSASDDRLDSRGCVAVGQRIIAGRHSYISSGVMLHGIRTGPIRVLHFGLGPDRRRRRPAGRGAQGFKIVGAVDIDPAKVGRDLGDVAGLGRPLRVKVSDDARKAIKASKPDVVVLCTSSSLKKVLPQIEAILKLKVPIVSTTEELAYPTQGEHALRARDPPAREEGQGRGARHRRESRAS